MKAEKINVIYDKGHGECLYFKNISEVNFVMGEDCDDKIYTRFEPIEALLRQARDALKYVEYASGKHPVNLAIVAIDQFLRETK